jgi:ribose 5-phosphate isomerase B
MKVYIGADHAGFEMKGKMIEILRNKVATPIIDIGCHSTEALDYPDIVKEAVSYLKEDDVFGVLICGTGIGMSIAANRYPWIRAALCHNMLCAERAKQHNNANVLIFGSLFVNPEDGADMVIRFLSSAFEGGRHARRIAKLDIVNES